MLNNGVSPQLYAYLRQTNIYFGSKPPNLPPIFMAILTERGSLPNSIPVLVEQNWAQNLRDKLPMGKTQKRTNHHNRINNFMAWEVLNWHSNSQTAFHLHLNEQTESFDISLCNLGFRCDQLITHPLQHHKGCQGASSQCKAKSPSTRRKEFKLPLHHLKFGQVTITGAGSYHVRAENNLT